MSGVGFSPAWGTIFVRQAVLLAGVPGYSCASILLHQLIGLSHISCNNLERDIKLNKKGKKNCFTHSQNQKMILILVRHWGKSLKYNYYSSEQKFYIRGLVKSSVTGVFIAFNRQIGCCIIHYLKG